LKSNTGKKIDLLEKRIAKIEKVVFGKKTKSVPSKKSFAGLVGGIDLLIENEFFNKPKLVTEVQDELRKESYFHTLQATDTALRRSYVKTKKILTRIKIDGVWQYVIRK